MHDQHVGLAVAFERLVTLPPAAALDDGNQIRPTFEKFGRAAVAQAMRGMVRDAEQQLLGPPKEKEKGETENGKPSKRVYTGNAIIQAYAEGGAGVAADEL